MFFPLVRKTDLETQRSLPTASHYQDSALIDWPLSFLKAVTIVGMGQAKLTFKYHGRHERLTVIRVEVAKAILEERVALRQILAAMILRRAAQSSSINGVKQ